MAYSKVLPFNIPLHSMWELVQIQIGATVITRIYGLLQMKIMVTVRHLSSRQFTTPVLLGSMFRLLPRLLALPKQEKMQQHPLA